MSSIRASLKLITTPKKIEQEINKIIIKRFDTRFRDIGSKLTKILRTTIEQAITSSHDYSDVISGGLKTELGVVDPQTHLDQMVSIISSSTHVTTSRLRVVSGSVVGDMTAKAVLSDFSDVFNAGIGLYTTLKGDVIPWLEWLLKEGDKIIIRNYGVEFGHPEDSRTNDAIMRLNRRGWRVPSQYSGTIENNFITRAIDSSLNKMQDEIQKVFKQGLT